MTIEHKNITDPEVHEPKNISTALSQYLYVANGAGSGTWQQIGPLSLSGVSSNGVSGQVVSVDGSGGFSIKYVVAKGFIYFVNIPSPSTVTFPTVYTKVSPTTVVGGSSVEVSEATSAKLTYTGSATRQGLIEAEVVVGHAAGADRDVRIAIYKNGSMIASSETIRTVETATKREVFTFAESSLATNDYFEIYVKNDGASGDLSVYTYRLRLTGY